MSMSINRSAQRAIPLVLRHSLRTNRILYSSIPAIAILIPRQRLLSTQSSTTSNQASGTNPPPGFNIDQAKKPLKDQSPSQSASSSIKIPDQHKIPTDVSTALPKGEAAEIQSLTELASKKSSEDKALQKKKEDEKKLSLWEKVKHEAAHYWDGTKLLAAEVRISFALALKMAAGYELTRREHRQVTLSICSYCLPSD
jgi:LETM1 and EF-hand domain-containing protein 1